MLLDQKLHHTDLLFALAEPLNFLFKGQSFDEVRE